MAGLLGPFKPLGASSSESLAESLARISQSESSKFRGLGSLGNVLSEHSPLLPLAPAPSFLGSATAPPLPKPIPTLANALYPQTKRKAYFAFRFEDIMRVNNVRNAWKIDHPDNTAMRSFYDRSIWGKSKAQEPESLKALMREAMIHSSAVCVLVGKNTWQGPWVKYEIARSVVDERGLLAVHINGLNHHHRQAPDTRGYNPLHWMGLYHSPNANYYLYENTLQVDAHSSALSWAWKPYEDFKGPVPLPKYIPSIPVGQVMPLARFTAEYDYDPSTGRRDIGVWIDRAAAAVGR
jgi:hypothetical protein